MKQIIFYKDQNGNEPIKLWLKTLDITYMKRISMRLIRVENGNYGDYKKLDDEICELRFKFGSGYRIYFAEIDNMIILLINAGDKSTQLKDIKKAKEYLKEWRKHNEL